MKLVTTNKKTGKVKNNENSNTGNNTMANNKKNKSSLNIAFGTRNLKTPYAEVENAKLSFDDLSETFKLNKPLPKDLKQHPDSEKQDEYFVRGEISLAKSITVKDQTFNNVYARRNEFLSKADLIIIDGDESNNKKPLISPKKLVKILEKLPYQYILYTSFSHTKKKPRWRLVLHCHMLPEQLAPTNAKLIDELNTHRANIAFDDCANTWSQPWYYSVIRYPDLFEHYANTKGGSYKAVTSYKNANGESVSYKTKSKSRKKNRESIGEGGHFYDQTKSLALSYANEHKDLILGNKSSDDEAFNIILDRLKRDAENNDCDLDDYEFIDKVHKHIKDAVKRIKKENNKNSYATATTALDVFEDMTVTKEMVKEIDDAKPLIDEVLVKGRIVSFIGYQNSGKTTLMRHFCEVMAIKSSVIYINMDAPPDEIKFQQKHADKFGYKLISPVMANMSNAKVIEKLEALANSDMDLGGTVIIIDTTKKLVNVNQKDKVAEFLNVLRGPNSKGCTIILLQHTNKYRDSEGGLIHAGTQDFLDDVDETNFIDSMRPCDDVQNIAIYPDKLRNTFVKKTSYTYNRKTREITKDKMFKDVRVIEKVASKVKKSDDVNILKIIETILDGTVVKGQIVSVVTTETDFSERNTRKLLDALSNENNPNQIFVCEQNKNKRNAIEYSMKFDFDYAFYEKQYGLKKVSKK